MMALVQTRSLAPTRAERVALAASAAIAAWVAARMEARAARTAGAPFTEGRVGGFRVSEHAREEQARRASLLGLR